MLIRHMMKAGTTAWLVAAASIASIPVGAEPWEKARGGPASRFMDVTRADGVLVPEALARNDRAQADANTTRIAQIMASAPQGATVYFPAGDYYFRGSALPNHGTIETSQAGIILAGDGPGTTNLIQTDMRRDFGFEPRANLKYVPCATIRVRHKGSAVRGLSVVPDPSAPLGTVLPTAAIQVAHIRYYPDNNIGIVDTTGVGADFLVDTVVIQNVNVGQNAHGGIQAAQFFELGVDIIGSGGHVRVFDMNRLDARNGIRLDCGNHCPQGDYVFENIHMIGRHGVTNGGVFFDWIGGQAPSLRNCVATFTNGFHAGPLGAHGDRLEPSPEGEVFRRSGKGWDWLTWHMHEVPDNPDPGLRTAFYGLPRHATVARIGSEPRCGGTEWTEGRHFRTEKVLEPPELRGATRIHWLADPPSSGSKYFVTFSMPIEYRVHDLQWGGIWNCSFQEALQTSPDGYAVRFDSQGFGHLNPDFGFRCGYGFSISDNFILNGDILLRGDLDYMLASRNVIGSSGFRIEGAESRCSMTRMTLEGNRMDSLSVAGLCSDIRIEDNSLDGAILVESPGSGRALTIARNRVDGGKGPAIVVSARNLEDLRVQDNNVRHQSACAISLAGASSGIVSGNILRPGGGRAIQTRGCRGLEIRQ
jgi:hypothetical protein